MLGTTAEKVKNPVEEKEGITVLVVGVEVDPTPKVSVADVAAVTSTLIVSKMS